MPNRVLTRVIRSPTGWVTSGSPVWRERSGVVVIALAFLSIDGLVSQTGR
jgi:hypothetical protein